MAGTGSGDTQDAPLDHWHLLADRLVTRARATGGTKANWPPPSHPPIEVLGTRVLFFLGIRPSCWPGSPTAPRFQDPPPSTPLPGLVRRLPGLTLGLFFFLGTPKGPPPGPENAEILPPISLPSPVSHSPPSPTLVVGLSDPCKQRVGGQQRAGGRCPFLWRARSPTNGARRPRGQPEERGVQLRPSAQRKPFFPFS